MVGIILYGPFELAPYSKKYMKILSDLGIEYDLIGWSKDEKTFYSGENVYMYDGKSADRYSSVFSKITPALGYRKFVKGIIKEKKYDNLIVLTTQTAILIADVLLKRYRKKFLFDYRDKSYEYIKPYGILVNSVIKASSDTVISSEWFSKFLTNKKEYILAHNLQKDFLPYRVHECKKKKNGEKIIAGYIGALRSFEYHRELIDSFKNDKRFEFHTFGCGDDIERLRKYSESYDNIFIHGAYVESEKYKILDKFDIMCYNYPYSYVNDGAVANKYYDALIMKKPMFVNVKTAVGKFVADNGMGVGVDEHGTDTAERIYNWYMNFDTEKFVNNCDYYLDRYIKEDDLFEEKIKNIFKAGILNEKNSHC